MAISVIMLLNAILVGISLVALVGLEWTWLLVYGISERFLSNIEYIYIMNIYGIQLYLIFII